MTVYFHSFYHSIHYVSKPVSFHGIRLWKQFHQIKSMVHLVLVLVKFASKFLCRKLMPIYKINLYLIEKIEKKKVPYHI